MDDTATTRNHGWLQPRDGGDDPAVVEPALVIAWSLAEPARAGEVAFVPAGEGGVLGRGAAAAGEPGGRIAFVAQRPERNQPTAPLAGAGLSRNQLRARCEGAAIRITRLGRCRTTVNGAPADDTLVRPGDVISLEGELILLCAARPRLIPRLHADARAPHPFGEPDAHGLVGESPALWALRDRLAFVGPREPHVLVLGESGAGKELCARAVHALSSRAGRPLVSRNAATLPPGLVDAELFGNARDYPNPGLAERPGLLGEAHGSTLFLDEIGEMPPALQAHLLRALDAGGEYQRLGDAAVRRADVRLVAATNRSPVELKHDFLARLALTVEVPGLGDRREDVPLVARHLLRRMASRDAALGARFFEGWDGKRAEPRVSPALVGALLRHRFTHHVRELAGILWRAVASSPKHYVDRTAEVDALLSIDAPAPRAEAPGAAEIDAALERAGGNVTRAARELGMSSRDALYRLMKKLGVAPRRGAAEDDE